MARGTRGGARRALSPRGGAARPEQDRGGGRGGRYPQEVCPLDPNKTAERTRVSVVERGVYCFRCASRGSGFRPWRSLIEGVEPGEVKNVIRDAVRGRTHWEHARHIPDL